MSEPKIILDNAGIHNSSDWVSRLKKEKLYQDQSTVLVIPTRGVISARVVQNWMGLMSPMNQMFTRMFIIGMEVGAAYSYAVESILSHPILSKWKYVLTLEEDNIIPPDGLMTLIKNIGDFGAIGGLYWTKGPGGQPMCYGNPNMTPLNFIPQIPTPNTITECNGLGMGFTLFKISMLKDMYKKQNGAPLFQTLQQYVPGQGASAATQDLYFFQKAREAGYRFACDSTVLVGHYDINTDIVW
jgi:hypothetical protein